MPKIDHRDSRAISDIDCPSCRAKAGKQCVWPYEPGRARPSCHPERRRANQERLRQLPPRCHVNAHILFPSGLVDRWTFDWDASDQRIDFARRADAAIRQGAVVTTRREKNDAT